jgi:iron(III) transport system substrate-binding protein
MAAHAKLRTLVVALLGVVCLAGAATPKAASIEDELVVQTPMSAFVVESMLKEFVQYARERTGVAVTFRVLRAGTPVSYERIVGWGGQPEADVFWGGEPVLFDDLAIRGLLTRLDVRNDVWNAIPPTIGAPKPIPLRHPDRLWVGTALEAYGLVFSPRLLKQLGMPELREWDDVLHLRLKGQVVQCTPARSSSSHATYEVILQTRGDVEGWAWLKRLAASTGAFVKTSRDVPAAVARTEFAVGFGVPSYYAFEERLAGFDIRFVAPRYAFVTPEPFAVLAGARHPRAARLFAGFLLSERGQSLFAGRGLFPVIPKYKVHGPPGSTAELAVQLTGGLRSFFDPPVANVYDAEIARSRFRDVNERFQTEIEAAWRKP